MMADATHRPDAQMKDKSDIVDNWLPRYTGVPLDQFGQHILLTNFGGYLSHFSEITGASRMSRGSAGMVAVAIRRSPPRSSWRSR